MHPSHMAQYAVACLEGLENPLTPQALSREQKVPLEDCLYILRQFAAAGLVQETALGTFERRFPMEELTAFEVLGALWQHPTEQNIQTLYGSEKFSTDHVAGLFAQAGVGLQG